MKYENGEGAVLNGYLLDTNTALIALTTPDDMTVAVREAVLSG